MTEETTVPQDEPQGEAAIAAKEASATEPTADKPVEAKKEEKSEWYIDVITKLRADKRETLTKAQQLELENAELKAKLANEQKPEPTSLTDAQITQRARELADQDRFNAACNDVYKKGKESFVNFDSAVANLNAVGAIGQNPDFLKAVTELPNAHIVLNHLGNNPQEAARITSLPPLKMAIELARVEGEITSPKAKPISSAPPPLTPVNGKGKADIDLSDPDLDMKRWIEQRRKEKEARYKSGN